VEVYRRVAQQRGEAAALDAIALMQAGALSDLDLATAALAARLGIELRLPLADSIVLATARRFDATLWTQDSDFEGIEGVEYRAKR
jgi:predicted nucleic acid-binding protein